MKQLPVLQFYETYRNTEAIVSPLVRQLRGPEKKVSALLTQLPRMHNLIIFSQRNRTEEREFYLRMAIQENCSKRELERQFKAARFKRSVLNSAKVMSLVTQTHTRHSRALLSGTQQSLWIPAFAGMTAVTGISNERVQAVPGA